jgi:hypothetical protein
MLFGTRLTFDNNPSFFGGFTLSVWQGPKRLCIVSSEISDPVFDAIYRQGGVVIKPEVGYVDQAFNDALLQWCIRETEQRLIHGWFDEKPGGVIPIQVTAADVPSIITFRRDKICDYQRAAGRELFCSAASGEDKSVTFQEGPAKLAPTTRELCRGCDLPVTALRCAHLAHPTVGSDLTYTSSTKVTKRFMVNGYCELGKNMNGNGAKCRAGGNDCWERPVEPVSEVESAPYSSRDLPVAFDFLNVIWQRAFKRQLFMKAAFQKSAALSLPCGNRDEFATRVGDLNELLRKMEIPDELLPDDNKPSGKHPIPEAEKLNRLSGCIRSKLTSDEHDQIAHAIEILKTINVVRNKITHGGAELIDALRYLGMKYPIIDYSESWDRIRAKAAEALSIIRASLETLE